MKNTLVILFIALTINITFSQKIDKSKEELKTGNNSNSSSSNSSSSNSSSDSSESSAFGIFRFIIESFYYTIGDYGNEKHLYSRLTKYPYFDGESGNFQKENDSIQNGNVMRFDVENHFLYSNNNLFGNHLKAKFRPFQYFYLQSDYRELIEKNLFIKYCTDFDNKYKIIKKWNSSRQFFYTIYSFDKSILPDGGFEDFYYLSNGELNEVLPLAFRKIGMNEIASIIDKANFKFELDKKNYSKNFEKYWLDETEKIPKPKEFNELNKELFKVYDQDIIKLKLIHFIRNNKNDFID